MISIKNIAFPIFHQEVYHIVSSALDPSSSQALVLVSKVNALKSTLSQKQEVIKDTSLSNPRAN